MQATAEKRPMSVFFAVLALLLAVIAVGSTLRAPKETDSEKTPAPKEVSVYDANETPRMLMAAKVDKQNVITITAQVPGIVSYIYAQDGQAIGAGYPIATLSDTYDGRRVADVDASSANNASRLTQEISDRQSSIADQNLDDSPKNSSTETVILRKQLAIEKRAAELNAQTARLGASKANIANAIYSPVSPAKGSVERIHVSPGDYVTPGTAIATIRLDQADTTLEALVPLSIASLVSVDAPTFLTLNDTRQEIYPISISKEATRGQSYSILYSLPAEDAPYLSNNSFVSLSIPFDGKNDDGFLVPIDAVTVARDASYLFVAKESTAQAKIVKTGNVYGDYVEILDGITPDEKVILNRNVLDGDSIAISNSPNF